MIPAAEDLCIGMVGFLDGSTRSPGGKDGPDLVVHPLGNLCALQVFLGLFPQMQEACPGPAHLRGLAEATAMNDTSMHIPTQPVVLVLGGGNALGSYLAGAYEQLQLQGIEPRWIVGGSIGAIMGAIIAGNAPEDRVPRLREFWDQATIHSTGGLQHGTGIRHVYNEMHTALALMFGRPGLFRHRFPGMLSALPWMPDDVSLYDHAPLVRTLERVVDFDRLNRADMRLTVGCVDLVTGEDVFFDNTRDELTPEHFLATSAITPVFPPVEIGGRLLADPGYTNNLPVEAPFLEPLDGDFTCIAVDLFSLQGERPAKLDAAAERAKDLVFASSSHRAIKALLREYALREELQPDGPSATLLHMAYQSGSDERVGKAFDYSPSSIHDRWATGRRDMASSLELLGTAPSEKRRLRYLVLDPGQAAASAQAGAAGSRQIMDLPPASPPRPSSARRGSRAPRS